MRVRTSDLNMGTDGPQPMAYRVTVTQVGSEAAAQGGGDVFDLADVLHVGARHSLQSGLVAPLDQVSSPLHICCAELRAHRSLCRRMCLTRKRCLLERVPCGPSACCHACPLLSAKLYHGETDNGGTRAPVCLASLSLCTSWSQPRAKSTALPFTAKAERAFTSPLAALPCGSRPSLSPRISWSNPARMILSRCNG